MRAAILAALLVALTTAGCKTDGKDTPPKLGLADGTDTMATGSVRGALRAAGFDEGVAAWYRDRGAAMPLTNRLAYCHGFGCEFKTAIPFSDGDVATLTALFDHHKASPAEERVAINLADQWWEKKADSVIGAPPDKRGSDLADAHKQGQTDCIDEATNTTTLLLWLERTGLLRHHHVRRPESRGAFLYAHATAVMTDRTTGVDWVADSWMRDSGDPIDVMTLEEWFSRAYIDPTS